MPDQATPTSPATAEHSAHQFRLAAAMLAEMKRLAILPTPRNYALWFAYRYGEDPALVDRIAALLEAEAPFPPPLLDALHAEFVAPAHDGAGAARDTAALEAAAQGLVRHVADNQAAVQAYGETLAHWAVHLADAPTVTGLVNAVTALSAETARAVARNRALERQLSESTERIGVLRHTLAASMQEAATDALTGIANRRAFDLRLARAVQEGGGGQPVSVLLLDIDHFKKFNDTYGHKTGDLVLRLVGRVLMDNVKADDVPARYGGEEFAVLTHAALGEAASIAQRIGAAIAGLEIIPKGAGRGMDRVTVSIGVAQCRTADTAVTLVERTDLALYQAKNNGRAQMCLEIVPPTAPEG